MLVAKVNSTRAAIISVVTTLGGLVGLNIVNSFIDVLDSFCPDQVCVFILSLLIEQLCGLKLALERLSILGCAQSNGKLLNLGLALGEVLYEPDVSLLSVGHGLQDALGRLRHYNQ